MFLEVSISSEKREVLLQESTQEKAEASLFQFFLPINNLLKLGRKLNLSPLSFQKKSIINYDQDTILYADENINIARFNHKKRYEKHK